MKKRIVVTGLGIVSPLGNNVIDTWENIKNGTIGINNITEFDTSNYDIKIAGTIKNFLITDFTKKKLAKKFDPFIQYGIAAGMQAIEDAEITKIKKFKNNKIGIIIGSGIGGLTSIENNHKNLIKKNFKKINPIFIPNCILSTIASYLSIIYNFTGISLAISSACATGGHAICIAEQLIKNNKAKIIIAGGAEKATTPLALSGFSALKALTKNKNPKKASKPWDKNRDGFVISDGAACVVLEEYIHALKRNAKIYAEITSTHMNNDAYHIVSPHPNGNGIYECMKNAIKNSKININEINYINAHATSTQHGDNSEYLAIEKLINNNNTAISSTKSMTGHMLGAAGTIELIFTILSLKEQIAIANINLEYPDPKFKLLNLIKTNIKTKIKYAMSNSFGFGGTNTSIIVKNLLE